MRFSRLQTVAATALVLALLAIASIGPATGLWAAEDDDREVATRHIKLFDPSSILQACLPRAEMNVDIKLTAEKRGFDIFDITARHVAPNRSYTVFLLQQAGPPFGAAEYIGELNTDRQGNGHAEYHLIVDEAFAFTFVNGHFVRQDLHEVGVWFADPKDDDFCFGNGGGIVSGFDGDADAGALIFNSATPTPLPAISR